jgi:hypothetical protein
LPDTARVAARQVHDDTIGEVRRRIGWDMELQRGADEVCQIRAGVYARGWLRSTGMINCRLPSRANDSCGTPVKLPNTPSRLEPHGMRRKLSGLF